MKLDKIISLLLEGVGDMKKRVLLTVFMIFTLILSACGNSNNETENETESDVISVETTEITKGDLTSKKSLYGQTQPIEQTPIMLTQPGELDELKVKNGDNVKKDDDLAVIKSEAGEQTIEAPKKGVVANMPDSTGGMVSNEEPFAMIIDIDDIKIQATATQKMRDLFKKDKEVKVEKNKDKAKKKMSDLIKTNQEVTVEIDNEEYTGKVMALDPLTNENGEYELNVKVENEDDKIKIGESAKITVDKTLEKDVLIVPSEAIVTSEEEDFVYIVEDDKAKQIKVDIVESQTKETAIKGEIKAEDNVVINGQSLLSDDVEVDVKKDGDE